MGLTDPEKRAPAMNRRVAAGLMTLFGIIGISQLVVFILEIVSGRNWALSAGLSVCWMLAATGYFLEWRRAKRLAKDC